MKSVSNLFEYVAREGDATFSERRFCPVDSLCLSLFSYLPLADYIDSGFEKSYTLRELCGLYLIYQEECEAKYARRFSVGHTRFFRLAAKSRRFGDLRVTGYRELYDEREQMQFAALTVSHKESHFLSFRGTDDSLVGWKEDFNMSFLSATPSQLTASRYLSEAAEAFPNGKLFLGGHSKGGNLALFAAANAPSEIQARFGGIFAHDAPGFSESFFRTEGYRRIHARCRAFVPQTSIVGMILSTALSARVVHSESKGLLQHDPYSWTVEGCDFAYEKDTDLYSRFVDRTLSAWLSEMDLAHREAFVDALFELLTATEAKTVGDLTRRMTRSLTLISKKQKQMDEQTRQMLKNTVERLFSIAWERVREDSGIAEKESEVRAKLTEAYRPVRERIALLFEEKKEK